MRLFDVIRREWAEFRIVVVSGNAASTKQDWARLAFFHYCARHGPRFPWSALFILTTVAVEFLSLNFFVKHPDHMLAFWITTIAIAVIGVGCMTIYETKVHNRLKRMFTADFPDHAKHLT